MYLGRISGAKLGTVGKAFSSCSEQLLCGFATSRAPGKLWNVPETDWTLILVVADGPLSNVLLYSLVASLIETL